jgi:hypothetical protein
MKNPVLLTLLLISNGTILPSAENDYISRIAVPDRKISSIQAAVFAEQSKAAAIKFYNELKQDGELVYYERAKIGIRGNWIRVKIGIFENYEQAKISKNKLNQHLPQDAIISNDVLLIRDYRNDSAIKTPNAIWAKLDGKYVECFDFSELIFDPTRGNVRWDDYTQPFLSPDKKKILFEFDRKIYVVDILTSNRTIMDFKQNRPATFAGIANSVPQQSPSGKYIGFIDANLWESYSHLWLYTADSTFKIIQASNENAVKNFRWHPNKDIIFYIFGHAFGTVSVGGDIYATDTNGNHVMLIESDKSKNEEITTDISINDEYLNYKIALHDEFHSKILKIVEKKAKLNDLLSIFDSKTKK